MCGPSVGSPSAGTVSLRCPDSHELRVPSSRVPDRDREFTAVPRVLALGEGAFDRVRWSLLQRPQLPQRRFLARLDPEAVEDRAAGMAVAPVVPRSRDQVYRLHLLDPGRARGACCPVVSELQQFGLEVLALGDDPERRGPSRPFERPDQPGGDRDRLQEGRRSNKKKGIAADVVETVCAMANAEGGQVLVGVDESEGAPTDPSVPGPGRVVYGRRTCQQRSARRRDRARRQTSDV